MSPLNTHNYHNIVVLTGAGVSAGSGLSTFRGPDGKWKNELLEASDGRRVMELLPKMWEGYSKARQALPNFEPNEAHYALARWQQEWGSSRSITLLTQNVDGLHQKAGSTEVSELHGSLTETRCTNPDCPSEPFTDTKGYDHVPVCPVCGSPLRPNIVLFHEPLPVQHLQRAKNALREADLFISIGTSGIVAPASNFVVAAKQVGARTIYVNLAPLHTDSPFDEEIIGAAEEVLSSWLD
ncbi:NAD-dependent deacylase [bacterium]|nr:MAG: NAD-dependent deacylase [bacterium]